MKRPPRNPLKYLSPSQLLICVILFFAPWVEIQCPNPKGNPNTPIDQLDLKSENMVWVGQTQQSGLEIALGSVSYPDDKAKANADVFIKGRKGQSQLSAAPLLWLYPVGLLVGIVLGFAMRTGVKRKRVLAACCAGILLVVGVQAAMGLPVQKWAEAEHGASTRPQDAELAERWRLKYKFPFYLSLFLVVGAMGIALLEPSVMAPPPPKDDKDEEDDDIPRRKRR